MSPFSQKKFNSQHAQKPEKGCNTYRKGLCRQIFSKLLFRINERTADDGSVAAKETNKRFKGNPRSTLARARVRPQKTLTEKLLNLLLFYKQSTWAPAEGSVKAFFSLKKKPVSSERQNWGAKSERQQDGPNQAVRRKAIAILERKVFFLR